MKIVNVLILAMLQVTVIPVVSALSSNHQAQPATVRFVSNENMTTIYKRPGAAFYTPGEGVGLTDAQAALDI